MFQFSGTQLLCSECKQLITNPVTRMNLEVFLDCNVTIETNTAVKVKVRDQVTTY